MQKEEGSDVPRTTPALVRGIIVLKKGIVMTPFIETANELVNAVCLTSGYNDSLLEKIERYLAAYFAAIAYPVKMRSRAEPTEHQIETKVDLGFNVNRWGQAAMRLDWKGNLKQLDLPAVKRLGVGLSWLGKDWCT